MLEKESFVYSEPKTTWRDYYRQKARHLSTATSYQLKHQILLGTLSASHFLFYVTGIILYVLDFYLMFGTLFGIRYIMLVFYYGKILKRFQEKRLLLWIPILDFMYILYYITFTPILFFRKTIQWK